MTEETYAPTAAGNTGQVYNKKQLERKKKRDAKLKRELAAWAKLPDAKVEILVSVGGVHDSHPLNKAFGGSKGQIITVKKKDAEQLIKAGQAKEAK